MKKIFTCALALTQTHRRVICRSKQSILFLCNFLLLIFTNLNLQALNPQLDQTLGTEFNDYGYSIDKTYDGGYIVGGTISNDNNTKDILLIRLDASGDTLWTKNYGGTYSVMTKVIV